MKFLNYLQEEYCDLLRNWSGGVEIYVNPTADDLKELKSNNVDSIRFTAVNSTKKLFIWNAYNCNHSDMAEYLVKQKHMKPLKPRVALNPDVFNGNAAIRGRKLEISFSDDFSYFSVEKLKGRLEKDWEWLKQYFVNLDYIHNLQNKLKELSEEYVGNIDGAGIGSHFVGGHTEIFVNPSNKELRDAMNSGDGFWKGKVRFIADFVNKDLYVFKADTLHQNVEEYLRSEGKLKGTKATTEPGTKTIWGVADMWRGGKLAFVGSDSLSSDDPVMKQKDDWTTKWFEEPLIQTAKRMMHM